MIIRNFLTNYKQILSRDLQINRLLITYKRNFQNARYLLNANSTEKYRNYAVVNNENTQLDLSFENNEIAYKSKRNSELIRALFVFYTFSIKTIVDNQIKVIEIARKVLGKQLFLNFVRSTFFAQFVGGVDGNEIRPLVEQLRKSGITAMINYNAEEDLAGEKVAVPHKSTVKDIMDENKYYHESEPKCDKNLASTLNCIDTVADVSGLDGFTAIKITAFLRPQLLVKLSSLAYQLLNLKDEKAKPESSIFEYVNNGFEKMDLNDWKRTVEEKTNFGKIFKINAKDSALSLDEIGEFRNVLIRLDKMAKRASDRNVRMFIDAEQTYFQWAITELTIELMRKLNRNKIVVMNTYQNYLKSTHKTLKGHLQQSREEGFLFGAKLVRGAYMEQERLRAVQHSYEDPIQPTFDETTKNYEKNLLMSLNEIKSRDKNSLKIVAASHNEGTVQYAIEKLDELGIDRMDKSVYLAQLFGMCDYISYNLGSAGFPIIKCIPYGPIEEVIPYLTRRAQENRGIFDKVKKEKRLLRKELIRRIKSGQIF